jgi:hypothetical protein
VKAHTEGERKALGNFQREGGVKRANTSVEDEFP